MPSGAFSYEEVPGDCQWLSTPPDISGSIATCGDCCSAGKDCSAGWSVFLFYFFNYNYMAYICLAVINRLMKSQAFKSVGKPFKEIPRPQKSPTSNMIWVSPTTKNCIHIVE